MQRGCKVQEGGWVVTLGAVLPEGSVLGQAAGEQGDRWGPHLSPWSGLLALPLQRRRPDQGLVLMLF